MRAAGTMTDIKTRSSDVSMQWLMQDDDRNAAGLSLAKMIIDVGVTSELHRHTNCNECIHVLEGRIRQRIGETWIELCAGETCLIPEGVQHQSQNIDLDAAVLMIAYSSGKREYVAI